MSSGNTKTKLTLVTTNTAANTAEKQEIQEWKEIRRDRLINTLNRINFNDGEVFLKFRHSKYNTFVSLPAKPQPCLDQYFECQWDSPAELDKKFQNYIFENFFFSDGLKQIFVDAEPISMDSDGIRFTLPETALEINTRKVRRHKCSGVDVQISQDGFVFEGTLESFSAVSFSVLINNKGLNLDHHFRNDLHVNVVFRKDLVPLYSGTCEVYRITNKPKGYNIVLKPVKNHIQRFASQRQRNIRRKLSPSPHIAFRHPFTRKKVNLKINDISGVGFSVHENIERSVLIPGMIIPDLKLDFINGSTFTCTAQVIHKTIEELGVVKCGVAIIDIDLNDYEKIISILIQTKNNNSFLSTTDVDLDNLWDFFFETGFIYPEKYSYLQQKKECFKKLYQKLYCQNSSVAKHVIYQEQGEILGHVSMFRFSDNTWMIHHHAAAVAKNIKAGLVVAEHLGLFCNGLSRFPKSKMRYIALFFRPENKFPSRVFGGVAKSLNDSQKCSVDTFAYYLFNREESVAPVDSSWRIEPVSNEDIIGLNELYDKSSGGLMLQSLGLTCEDDLNQESVNEEYGKIELNRERHIFALKRKGELKAVVVVNLSELGLNMSDVTNCINMFVLDQDGFSEDVLDWALKNLSGKFSQHSIPVLLYPKEVLDNHKVNYKKVYNYLTLDVSYLDNYFVQLERILHLTERRRRK